MFLASLELSFWLAPLPSGSIAGSQEGPASLFWQMVALLLWFYLWTRGVPQNVVEASANSLWQGGRRRVHSVKGGLPK